MIKKVFILPLLGVLSFLGSSVAQDVVISEFLADNEDGITDDNGTRQDWIELRNTTAAAINLSGWYLTDEALRPNKWPFPAVSIPAGGTLLVWASEKDRRDPLLPLHTNFKLSANGEYLAILRPGVPQGPLQVSHQFSPTYPRQYEDVSYGLEQTTVNSTVVQQGTACRYLVPGNGNLDVNFGINASNWIGTAFNDSAWPAAANGLPLKFAQNTTTHQYDLITGTDVETPLYNVRTSIYVRIPFTVADVASLSTAKLRMQIDDGYIAYLNGVPVPVAEFNKPENEGAAILFWNQPATAEFPNAFATTWQETQLDKASLQPGTNVLCLHAFNRAIANTDFLVWPEVVFSQTSVAPNTASVQYFRVPTPNVANVNGSSNPGPLISDTLKNVPAVTVPVFANAEADSVTEFSGNQGQGGWTYGLANYGSGVPGSDVYDPNTITVLAGGASAGAYAPPTNVWNGSVWDLTASGAPWTNHTATGTHPSDSNPNTQPLHAAVRRWTSDVAGDFVLAGFFQRAATTSDGTTGHVFLNGTRLFSSVSVGDAKPFQLPVTLAVGDKVDMVVDVGPANEDASDTTNLQLRVLPAPTGPPVTMVVTSNVQPSVRPVSSVTCQFRVGTFPENAVAMNDGGTNGDAVAGDKIYSCSVDITLVPPGQLLRWRIVSADDQANTATDPTFTDPLNSPQYYGTITTDLSTSTSQLNVFHWFPVSTANAASPAGDRGSVIYLGQFYDNVRAKVHGQSTAGFAKKSYGFDFARDNRFEYKLGEKRVRDILLLSNWADKSKMRNTLAWEAYRAAGTPGLFAFPVRVHQSGQFYGVYDMVEDADDLYLDRAGLDAEGALYKMYNSFNAANASYSGVEKKTRQDETNADLNTLLTSVNTAVALNTRRQYAYDNLNLPELANNLAVTALLTNNDQGHKNYFLYRDTEGTREWTILPWDCDLSFGHTWTASTFAQTTGAPQIGANYFDDHIDSQRGLQQGAANWIKTLLYGQPEFNKMYLRRLRTLMDQWLGDVNATTGYFETRMAAVMETIDPASVTPTQSDAWLDGQRWGIWWTTLPWKNTNANGNTTVASTAGNFAQVWNMHGPRPSMGRIIDPNGNPTSTVLADSVNNLALTSYISSANYTTGGATVLAAGATGTNSSLVYTASTYVPFGGSAVSNGASPPTFTHTNAPTTVHPYLKGRRLRLYDTSATRLTSSGAVIPDAQPASINITFEAVEANPGAMGGLNQSAEYFILRNNEATEVDLSGWQITGAVTYTLPGGCVVAPANPSSTLPNAANLPLLHVAKSPHHFRQRANGPRGNENRLVVGPYDGQLSARGEIIELRKPDGTLVASNAYMAAATPMQDSLRVVELLYAPTAPTPAELAVNNAFQAGDFEYIVLENTSAAALTLTGASFTEGISFTFGTLSLAAGEKVVLTANVAAFALRNPAYTGTVVGGFLGGLDNGGEQLHLVDNVGESILEFSYDGAWYWPADDLGHSLVIDDKSAPYASWDLETAWKPSLQAGGLGTATGVIYKNFRAASFSPTQQVDESASGPEADLDFDGTSNLVEYSAKGNPSTPVSNLLPTHGSVSALGQPYATITFRRHKTALDLQYTPEASEDLGTWEPLTEQVGSAVDNGDGTETVTYRDTVPNTSQRRFLQLRVNLVVP